MSVVGSGTDVADVETCGVRVGGGVAGFRLLRAATSGNDVGWSSSGRLYAENPSDGEFSILRADPEAQVEGRRWSRLGGCDEPKCDADETGDTECPREAARERPRRVMIDRRDERRRTSGRGAVIS